MTPLRPTLRIASLLAVILIDSVGYTIVVPVLAAALMNDPPQMMAGNSAGLRYLAYGIALGAYELLMLYAAPVLGEISDRVGRKRILVLSMLGMALSFVLIGSAIAFNLVALLIFGRIIGGATAGSQAVAQAAAIDGSSEENRNLTLNLCLLASSVGFVLGPLIGGSLSHDAHAHLSNFTMPMFATAGIALVGLAMVAFAVDEKPRTAPHPPGRINLMMGVEGFRSALLDPAIRHLVIVFGLMQIAWGTYFLFLPSLLLNRFIQDAGTVSLMMAVLGVGFCFAYGLFLPLLEKRIAPRALASWGLWITVALIAISLVSYSMAVQWAIALPMAIAVSVAYGAIINLFSRAVSDERQGWVLGIAVSTNALVWGLSSILNGGLSSISYVAPFFLCLATLAASALLVSMPPRAPAITDRVTP